MAVIDDADLVVTLPLLKSNIIDPLPKTCQKVFVSSFDWRSELSSAIQVKLTLNDSAYPETVTDHFIKLKNEGDKLRLIRLVCRELSSSSRAQAMVFFTVSSAFCIRFGLKHTLAFYVFISLTEERRCGKVYRRIQSQTLFLCSAYWHC